ncbi:VF_A0006 family four-cysteine protein [Dongshaea marina]|uniref:VF_A0006 family four-cysteine protein n=1 Tax=Dongshaea marina TaxID=2047966 RepID=UPI000D3E7467|nr:VF_A0006 family four-cysteine protein [Dongshaea marina]
MNIKKLITLAFPLLASSNVLASIPDEKSYDQCVSQYVYPIEDKAVAREAKHACSELHDSYSLLGDDDTNYYQCILDGSATVNNVIALREMKKSCEQKYRSLW